MKNILLFLLVFVSFGVLSTQASFSYTPIPETVDHEYLANVIGQEVVAFLDNNPSAYYNLNTIRDFVGERLKYHIAEWKDTDFSWGKDWHYERFAFFDSNGDLIIGCGNQVLARIETGNNGSSRDYTIPGCGSQITGWNETWSDCSINSKWTTQGTITCRQEITHTAQQGNCGYQLATDTTICDATNSNCSTKTNIHPNCIKDDCYDEPKPTKTYEDTLLSLNLSSPTVQGGTVYANNSDSVSIQVFLSGDPKQSKSVVGWNGEGILKNFKDAGRVPSDQINKTGLALNLSQINTVTISDGARPTSLTLEPIQSRSPFSINNGSISFLAGTTNLSLNHIKYHFKKPFTGKILTRDTKTMNWSGSVILGTKMRHKVTLNEKSSLTWNGLTSYSLNDFASDIGVTDPDLKAELSSVSGATRSSKLGTIFETRINSSANAQDLSRASFQIAYPHISYTLDGNTIQYYLTTGDSGDDTTPISTNGSDFLGVRVIGAIQANGKSEFTGQNENISNISSSEAKTTIRQNAYLAIQSMASGQTINGIKYVEGSDELISGNVSYETLVVKNGNVIITGDLNVSNKKLGIIVLSDGYNTVDGYKGKGNIYVKPEVTQINASMYADGGLISISPDQDIYVGDSVKRGEDLSKQLYIFGSLFTRNTIGGAIFRGGNYTLPGNSSTQSFDIALQYDLNYLRRGNVGCDNNSNHNCTDPGEYTEATIIKYNSQLQTNPPKLFQN